MYKRSLHGVLFVTLFYYDTKRDGYETLLANYLGIVMSEGFRFVDVVIKTHILLLNWYILPLYKQIVFIDIHIYIHRDVILFIMSDLALKNSVN